MRRSALIEGSVIAAALLAAAPAAAQDAAAKQYVDVKIEAPPEQEGLELSLKNGATFSFVNSNNMIGQPDGLTLTFGLKFDGTAIYRHKGHEWRNVLGLNETLTRTPAVDRFIKSADALAFESIYLYFFRPWVGPFARFTLGTPLFQGVDVRSKPTDYVIAHADGTKETLSGVTQPLGLTNPLRPLTMKETIGPFVRPVTSEKISAEARIGLGALQTLAAGQRLLKDDPKTDTVEVQELKNVFQLGGEASLEVWGAFYDKKITYKLGIGALMPFVSDKAKTDTRNPLQLTNIDLGGALSFKIVEWASLDYELKLMRQPQLTDVIQIRNGLMLTLGLGYDKKPPPPPEKPAAKPADKPAPAAVPATTTPP
jgi:hypothetical protein